MKTQRFDFNLKPLQLHTSITTIGSIPEAQNFNAHTGEYTPDYTLTPLVIQPWVSILDKDEILTPGKVNASLTNIKWHEIIGGISTVIGSDNTNYSITTSGRYAGQIKVKRNVEPDVPITLEFKCDYIDPRNNQIHSIRKSKLIKCSNASDATRVELNAAQQTIYNPFINGDTQSVSATVWIGENKCSESKYSLVWEVTGEDDSWHVAGSDEVMDYHISTDGNTALVNKRLMGSNMSLRCRCKYSAEGDPDDIVLSESTPQATASFVRRIPKFESKYIGVPYNIPYGTRTLTPEMVIQTTNGVITNPEKELLPLWYIATNKSSGSLDYRLVGHGLTPTIPTTAMSILHGAVIGYNVLDRGAAGALELGDGSILCDGDGKILIIK